jgi:hypothetical protein
MSLFVPSLPDRRPNDKYTVNTSHRYQFVKNVSLRYYLVAAVIHIQSVCRQICVCVCVCVHIYIYIYIHILFVIETLVGQKK